MNGLTISELAERAGVNVSTVRYYERIGLVPDPERSPSGYRLYQPDHETRLQFVTRLRRLGLSVEQIVELSGVWDGTNCATTRARVSGVLDGNITDIERRIAELSRLVADLRDVRIRLEHGPSECTPDLGCCTPSLSDAVSINLETRETEVSDVKSVAAPSTAELVCDLRSSFETPTERVAAFAELFGEGLIDHRPVKGVSTFRFVRSREVEDRLRDLVAKEQRCCSFLRFDISEHGDELHVALTSDTPAGNKVIPLFTEIADGTLDATNHSAIQQRAADVGLTVLTKEQAVPANPRNTASTDCESCNSESST